MKKKAYFLFFFYISFCFSAYAKKELYTIWQDTVVVNDPLIEKIIDSKAMQRLKLIDQSGPAPYIGLLPYFSRYDHSIGVFVLLQKAQVSKIEQIAGLLHDTSHTVFSHLGDNLFYHEQQEKSYQDTIHLCFLRSMKIDEIISRYNITIKDLDPDDPKYTALERPLPDLCADRIQYNIHTAVILNKISKLEAKEIVDDLKFHNGVWFFTNKNTAKKFAMIPLYLIKELWGAPFNTVVYDYFHKILKRAIEIKLVSKDELHFSVDQNVMQKIENSNDKIIKNLLNKCKEDAESFRLAKYGNGQINIKPKFRGIDPLILDNNQYKKLSQLDEDFSKKFKEVQNWCKNGYGINLPNSED
ncbi:hypothetical protein [Candidatus Tisiphia endosymbiont of Oplodontha viridula]|uniref:hypothetical protein n=1 Tax=Candidatus Tisiphia endosymbiont of Oplodontha viridula TaxID=3077925 RepID=UPI0035C93EFD